MKEIVILFFILSLIACSQGEQEAIVFPKGFKGSILIIYNQPDGQAVSTNKGQRIYKIPWGGVLKTRFGKNTGLRSPTSYYIDTLLNENRIPSYFIFDDIPENQLVGFMGESGTTYIDVDGEKPIEFVFHFIGEKSEIKKAIQDADSINIRALVNSK